MSPALTVLVAVLSSPLVGIIVNFILSKTHAPDGPTRRFTTAFLGALPGQVQAVYAAAQPGPDKAARVIQAIDAVAVGVDVAAKASEGDK